MSKNSIVFEKIHVDRALGIGRGDGFTVNGLVAGVNLIHGPNGIGKSTLARVIHELIWPGRTGLERPTVSGLLQIADDHWNIDIDAGQVQLSGSRSGIVPGCGPSEARSRYHLPLHELIVEQDAAFAKAVADACQGGFDIDAAAKAAGFSSSPSGSRKEGRLLASAMKARRDAGQAQGNIDTKAQGLSEMRDRQTAASNASQKVDALKQAVQYHEEVIKRDNLKDSLDQLPQEIGLLKGDERNQLNKLDTMDRDRQKELTDQKEILVSANEIIASTELGENGVQTIVFEKLELYRKRLEQNESDLESREDELQRALADVNQRSACLSSTLSQKELEAFNVIELTDLTEIARRAHRCEAERKVLELKKNWLSPSDTARSEFDAGEAQEGIAALARWLSSSKSENTPAQQPMALIWTAISVIALLALSLATLHHWAWIFAAISGVAIAFFALKRRSHDVSDEGISHRRAYEQTDLPKLVNWTPEGVAKQLNGLNRSLAPLTLASEKAQQLQNLRPEIIAVDERKSELEEKIARVRERLGVHVTIEDEWLPIFVENLSHWQNAMSTADQLGSSVAHLQGKREECLESVNTILAKYGYGTTHDLESTKANIEDLRSRNRDWTEASRDLKDTNNRIQDTIIPAIKSITAQRDEISKRLGISWEKSEVIDAWLKELPKFNSLKEKISKIESIVNHCEQGLDKHDELLALTLQECKDQIIVEESLAGEYETITRDIAVIEADIGAAKKKFELTDAIAAEVLARDELIGARDRRACSVVGGELTTWVKKQTLDKSRPEVFQRAKSLLATITHGNLRLSLDDKVVPPIFRAASYGGAERPVEALSIGERVQLLLAIRLAFLEYDEIVKLPLILDETLGTSDDQRVELMIETVMQIARDGRQVFYFTAQHDEVGKWVASLERADLPYRVIDLVKERNHEAAKTQPLSIAEIKRPEVPSPDNLTYAQYGQSLGVAAIEPANSNIGRIHLWHFLSDTNELYLLLSKGIETWGQLKTLLDCTDQPIKGVSESGIRRGQAAAKAINTACRTWRVGRGKPIDREVLMESNIVSEAFLDQLTALAGELNGDARDLLESLENKKIKGWRQNNNEPLREYFEANGYLNMEEPMDTDDIRIRTMAAVLDETEKALIDQTWLDSLISGLPR